jgi:hypothetical protein
MGLPDAGGRSGQIWVGAKLLTSEFWPKAERSEDFLEFRTLLI